MHISRGGIFFQKKINLRLIDRLIFHLASRIIYFARLSSPVHYNSIILPQWLFLADIVFLWHISHNVKSVPWILRTFEVTWIRFETSFSTEKKKTSETATPRDCEDPFAKFTVLGILEFWKIWQYTDKRLIYVLASRGNLVSNDKRKRGKISVYIIICIIFCMLISYSIIGLRSGERGCNL